MDIKRSQSPSYQPSVNQPAAFIQPTEPNIESTSKKESFNPNQPLDPPSKRPRNALPHLHPQPQRRPLIFNTVTVALGINCRGSGLCPRASFNDNSKSSETIVQALRDAILTDADSSSTTYSNGDHIICVSQSQAITVGGSVSAGTTVGASGTFSLSGDIGEGGICVFAQHMASGATIDLGTIRPLTDALLKHGCSTCGSVPINFVTKGSNDPSDGILTFNYVKNPYCIGSCMSASGTPQNNTKLRREIGEVPKRLARPLFE